MFLTFTNDSKTDFVNRKRNYSYYILTSNEKFLLKYVLTFTIVSKSVLLILKAGNGIIQTGNGYISQTSSKNFFHKMFPTFTNESKTGFVNKKWN